MSAPDGELIRSGDPEVVRAIAELSRAALRTEDLEYPRPRGPGGDRRARGRPRRPPVPRAGRLRGRPRDGGGPLGPVDLEPVVADALDDIRLRIEESDASVDVGELPTVRGDADQLRQAFQNLLENAIEYSGDDPPRLEVDAEPDGDRWLVSVADESVGVDPSDADRIFDVFERLHARDEHAGTGLGIALVRRIVERHDGEIRVDPEPGEGATLTVALPAAEE